MALPVVGQQVMVSDDFGGAEQVYGEEAQATTFASALPLNLLGNYWVSGTGADRGVGWDGSYMTLGGVTPWFDDTLNGAWFSEMRLHLSEDAGFFGNFGIGRRQVFRELMHPFMAGFSFWYDVDEDEYDRFGHTFHQLGVSGELVFDGWMARINGYFPLDTTDHFLGYEGSTFFENSVILQRGIDSAMKGFDAGFGFPVPFLAHWYGQWHFDGYHYSSEAVERVSGFSSRLDFTPINGFDVSGQVTHDNTFGTTGQMFLTWHFGGPSPRTSIARSIVRRTQRNDHIVRYHQDPIFAYNPNNSFSPWVAYHVDNTAADGGDGSFEMPFNKLKDAEAAANDRYDIIVVGAGNGTSDGQNAGIVLDPYQLLLGEGSQHFIPTQFGPAELSIPANGLRPTLTNPEGAAIELADGALVSSFLIEQAHTGILADGLTVGADVDRVNISGSDLDVFFPDFGGFGTSGASVLGVDIRSSTGTFTFTDVNIDSIAGVSFNVAGGAPDIFYRGDISEFGGLGVLVTGTTGGRITFNEFGFIDTSVDPDVIFSDLASLIDLIDLDTDALEIDDPNIFNDSSNVAVGEIVDDTILLVDVDGDLFFDHVDLFGAGIDVRGGTGSITFVRTSISSAGGPAINIEGGNTAFSYSGSISNSTGRAIRIVDTGPVGSASISGDISDFGGKGILIDNVAGAVSISGYSASGTTVPSITVKNSTGDIEFVNTSIDSPTGAGVDLLNNTDGRIAFTNLNVATAAAVGVRIENKGTTGNSDIVIDGESSIDAIGGEAVRLFSTNPTPISMTFEQLSSTGSPNNGLLLDNATGEISVDTLDLTISTAGASGVVIRNSDGLDANFKNFTSLSTAGTTTGNAVDLRDNESADINLGTVSITSAAGTGVYADNSGTIRIAGGTIAATGGPALDISDTDVDFILDSVSSTGSPGTGLYLGGPDGVTGTIRIGSTNVMGAQIGMIVENSNTAPLDVDFGDTVIDALEVGIQMNNNPMGTFDFNSLTITSTTLAAIELSGGIGDFTTGKTIIGSAGTPVQGKGVKLNNVEGDVTFDVLDIFNTNGTGLVANNPTTDATLTINGGLINTVMGGAISINSTTIDITLSTVNSTMAPASAILLDDVDGTLDIWNATTITDAAVGINITNSGAPGLVANFGDTTIGTTGQQGLGVSLTNNNPSGVTTFRSLDVTTSNGAGLVTVAGGTVNFITPATINATGGPAVNLDNLTTGQTNGVDGWTFANLTSIDSTTHGVKLDDLANDFIVTGTTTVTNAASNGILVQNNTTDVTFSDVAINGATNGVRVASSSGNFNLLGGTISVVTNDGVEINDSNATIDSLTIIAVPFQGIEVNTAGNDREVTLTNNIVTGNADGTPGPLGAFKEAIELNVNGTGTLTATISGNNISSNNNTIDAATSAAGGDLILALSDNIVESEFGVGVNVDGSLGGTITITEFADTHVNGTLNGLGGVRVESVVFDSDLVTVGLQEVSGGNTMSIGNFGDEVSGDGLELSNVTGSLAFNILDIFNTGGTGLIIENAANDPADFTLKTNNGYITTMFGTAIDIDTATLSMQQDLVSSSDAAGDAVRFNNATGAVRFGATSVVDAGTGIRVTNSDAAGLNINFGDTSIVTTVDTTGPQPLITNPSNDGVLLLDNNATDLFTFRSLNIDTVGGNGFTAFDGGTIDFRGDAPRIRTQGLLSITTGNLDPAQNPAAVVLRAGHALSLDSTDGTGTRGLTNGVAGWTFANLNSQSSTDNGVFLRNLIDDFTTTEGTFINDADGISLEIVGGTADFNFAGVNVTGRHNVGVQIDGIRGTATFANLDVDNNAVDNNGFVPQDQTVPPVQGVPNPASGNAVNILNTFDTDLASSGQVIINGGKINRAESDGIYIENSVATVRNTTITQEALPFAPLPAIVNLFPHDGISVVASGTGTSITLFEDNTIENPLGFFSVLQHAGISAYGRDSGTVNATIIHNRINMNDDPLGIPPTVIPSVVAYNFDAAAEINLNISGNHNGLGPPVGEFQLDNVAGGTINVSQASLADLIADNQGVAVVTAGVITFAAPAPPVP